MLDPKGTVIHHHADGLNFAGHRLQLSLTSSLEVIEQEWRHFEQIADCSPFQTVAWLGTWQRCVGAVTGVKPAIVLGRDENAELFFILPLAIEKTRFYRRLVFLGHELCDYNAPLLAANFSNVVPATQRIEWWQAVHDLLSETAGYEHDVVFLNKMPTTVGRQENPLLALNTIPNPSSGHISTLGNNWDAFYATKQRGDRRRRDRSRRKKFEEKGELRLEIPEDKATIVNTLAVLFEQKSGSFAKMGVRDLFAQPGYSEFFRNVATHASSPVHVSCLKVGGGRIAAATLGLVYRQRYYQILISYDHDLAQFAPGTIHLHELMRYAIGQGYRYFDFTIGDERYKLDWADTTLDLYDVVAGSNLRGRIVVTLTRFKLRAKRFVKHSPRLFLISTRLRALVASR